MGKMKRKLSFKYFMGFFLAFLTMGMVFPTMANAEDGVGVTVSILYQGNLLTVPKGTEAADKVAIPEGLRDIRFTLTNTKDPSKTYTTTLNRGNAGFPYTGAFTEYPKTVPFGDYTLRADNYDADKYEVYGLGRPQVRDFRVKVGKNTPNQLVGIWAKKTIQGIVSVDGKEIVTKDPSVIPESALPKELIGTTVTLTKGSESWTGTLNKATADGKLSLDFGNTLFSSGKYDVKINFPKNVTQIYKYTGPTSLLASYDKDTWDIPMTFEKIDSEKYNPTYPSEGVKAEKESTTEADVSVPEGQQLPDGTTFTPAGNVPGWVNIDKKTGKVTLTPGRDVEVGEHPVTVTVTYPDGSTKDIVLKVKVVEKPKADEKSNADEKSKTQIDSSKSGVKKVKLQKRSALASTGINDLFMLLTLGAGTLAAGMYLKKTVKK
ncbi:YPDG domain-containing protein [Actinomyces sp. zg-332]|uniref:Rib/alpha-like domain-containing protein n=1 Tax=Actinomyces sp. zg-332 TaxID=2708340 RepID=UPI001423776D|nr:Rib/alpha-like domain-containing protein [Actinomyces sp. zg-332]QPK94347.1 YPDG domain-containing protein [Actinomyces sp. zg-332]